MKLTLFKNSVISETLSNVGFFMVHSDGDIVYEYRNFEGVDYTIPKAAYDYYLVEEENY